MKVKRTERGWAGHFICAKDCLFRRNTLLECNKIKIVVSTVGLMRIKGEIETIGINRYYETTAFHSDRNDKRYYDADVTQEVDFESPWAIDKKYADDKANDMHETVVAEITKRLVAGEKFQKEKETP